MNTFSSALEAQKYFVNQKNQENLFVNYENNKYSVYEIFDKSPSDSIVKIEELDSSTYDEYVYDIETEAGNFQAGVGRIIVKNTDSIYTQFTIPGQESMNEEELLERIAKVSQECADRISETFKRPIELEFEKVFYPLLLFSKKRYCGKIYELDSKSNKMKFKSVDKKGIQVVRRDNCMLVKKICNPVINKILLDRDVEGAKLFARTEIANLLNNKFDIQDLVISKSLKAEYKEFTVRGNKLSKPAHVELAERMAQRDPMTAPKPGDRVPYVFIENRNELALQKDKIENPDYIVNNPQVKVDSLYYLTKQIESPLHTIFSVIIKDKKGNIFPMTNNKLSKECKQAIANQIWEDLKLTKINKLKTISQEDVNKLFKKKKN